MLRAGDELRLGIPRDGARAYVGLEGGVEAPLVLGSRSSDVRAGLGPAPLMTGDGVACGGAGGRAAPRRAKHDHMIRMKGKQTWTLRVLPGPGDPASDDGSPGDGRRRLIEGAAGRGALRRVAAVGPHGRRRGGRGFINGGPAALRGLRRRDDPAAAGRQPRYIIGGPPDDRRL